MLLTFIYVQILVNEFIFTKEISIRIFKDILPYKLFHNQEMGNDTEVYMHACPQQRSSNQNLGPFCLLCLLNF